MATKVIHVEIDDKEVEVVLKSARKADGIWRAELMGKAALGQSNDPKAMVGFYLHATCVAAVKEPDWVRNLPLDDFIERVGEADIDTWVAAAYEINPQWRQAMKQLAELGEDESKKIGTSESGLSKPTEEPTLVTSPVSTN